MSYTYTNGDGKEVLEEQRPDGRHEKVKTFLAAINQVISFIGDSNAGIAAAMTEEGVVKTRMDGVMSEEVPDEVGSIRLAFNRPVTNVQELSLRLSLEEEEIRFLLSPLRDSVDVVFVTDEDKKVQPTSAELLAQATSFVIAFTQEDSAEYPTIGSPALRSVPYNVIEHGMPGLEINEGTASFRVPAGLWKFWGHLTIRARRQTRVRPSLLNTANDTRMSFAPYRNNDFPTREDHYLLPLMGVLQANGDDWYRLNMFGQRIDTNRHRGNGPSTYSRLLFTKLR